MTLTTWNWIGVLDPSYRIRLQGCLREIISIVCVLHAWTVHQCSFISLSDSGWKQPDVSFCEGGPVVSCVPCTVSRVPELSGLKPYRVICPHEHSKMLRHWLFLAGILWTACQIQHVCKESESDNVACKSVNLDSGQGMTCHDEVWVCKHIGVITAYFTTSGESQCSVSVLLKCHLYKVKATMGSPKLILFMNINHVALEQSHHKPTQYYAIDDDRDLREPPSYIPI